MSERQPNVYLPNVYLPNVYLVGPMGVGKTTIGRRLATILQAQFMDTDELLEQRTGVSISHIFEIEGEQGFRDRESRILCEIAEQNQQVISTGGGMIMREENRELMTRSGIVIYLYAPFEVLWNRIRDSRHRPLLETENPQQTLRELMIQRDPLYRDSAEMVIQASTHADLTAHQIARKLKKLNPTSADNCHEKCSD